MRKIKVCPGIGDNIWLLQKLINSGEQFAFELPDGQPQRGKQIFDILPSVAGVASYNPLVRTADVLKGNIQMDYPTFKSIKANDFYLNCNTWLERGQRIDKFLPDLKTNYRIAWDTENEKANIDKLLPEGQKYIGIYTSSMRGATAWELWEEKEWFRLIASIYHEDKGYIFVLIGAEWDLDLSTRLAKVLQENKIPFINTVATESLGAVVEIMKRLHYFFAFPSGLGILAPTVGCPVTMLYPVHLRLMVNAWADLADIDSGLYTGWVKPTPEQVFSHAKKIGRI